MDADIKVVKVRLDELEDFVASVQFKGLENVPLSAYRVDSYLRNPRAREDDIVMYLLFERDELLAYRTLLSDKMYIEGQEVHVAWFSGNYVFPKHRRKGYSSMLLKEVRKDWNDQLLFSNYAPASKYVLDKQADFRVFQQLNGRRYYFRSGLGTLIPERYPAFRNLKGLFSGVDKLVNYFISKEVPSKKLIGNWHKIERLEDKDLLFLSDFKEEELFKRGKDEFEWILKYPWVKTNEEARDWDKRYHFSVFARQFDLSFYRWMYKGEIKGLIMVSVRDEAIKLHYAYLPDAAIATACEFLLGLAYAKKCLHLTIYHDEMISEMNNFGQYVLFSRAFRQAFLTSQKLLDIYPQLNSKIIHKGDGDAVFT